MEYSHSESISAYRVHQHLNKQDCNMSMVAMPQPTPHSAFSRECAWDENSQHGFSSFSTRRHNDTERVALPSIRQAVPEINDPRAAPSAASPVGGFGAGARTPPAYIHSPNQSKRRRLSIGDGREDRSSQIPRMYPSPQREYHGSRAMSPAPPSRSATDSWTSPPRRSPYAPHTPSLPSMRDSIPMEPSDARPTLPRLPNISFDRGFATMPRIRGRSADDDYPDNFRQVMGGHSGSGAVEGAHGHYRPGSYYGYHHPSRGHSLSLSSVQSFDRTPFSPNGGYGSSYHDYMRGEMAAMGMNGESKQRKRRGNLPKETTDKLRAWFVAHLHHPYPTEDEKQDLMRQTGLQMNQISNWFINARRRQLPTLLNNARAESDAISSGRLADMKRDSPPMSDGEGSAFDDDLEAIRHRHAANMSRGSV